VVGDSPPPSAVYAISTSLQACQSVAARGSVLEQAAEKWLSFVARSPDLSLSNGEQGLFVSLLPACKHLFVSSGHTSALNYTGWADRFRKRTRL
jgi:hypothetical protein